jgi:nitroreductase
LFDGLDEGGTVKVDHRTLFPGDMRSSVEFLLSRRSVRNYTGETVPRDLLQKAAEIAQRAPSVCNRQTGRLFIANDPSKIAKVLAFQNGNRGFGDKLGAVIVVAADLRYFNSSGERNQAYVDGGIFAMMLVQALHALHLGTCMLNWSVEAQHDHLMRKELDIPDYCAVITMIGCGFPAQNLSVAASPRISLDKVVNWLN